MKALKKLDPRLRRIVRTLGDDGAMRADVERGVTLADRQPGTLESGTVDGRSPGPVRAGDVTKRVVVELSIDTMPTEMHGWHCAHVVDRIYSAEVPVEAIADLSRMKGVKVVEAGRKWYPMLDSSMDAARVAPVHALPPAEMPRKGRGVVVGIIDFGMDYTLDDFREENGDTRLAWLWDQSLTPRDGEASPEGFGYGVEYDAAAIDRDLAADETFTLVRHDPGPEAHGTHVAGTAAGNGRSGDDAFPAGRHVGAAPEATIVFVQPTTRGNPGSLTDSSNVADAIAYVFARAEELGLPCVVNMSLGQNGGSHDGDSLVERAIDRMLEPNGRAFVSAAGNEHIWRGHASGTMATGDTRILDWRVGGKMPNPFTGGTTATGPDRSANEMEIWYSSRDRFAVTLRSPDGDVFGPVPAEDELLEMRDGMLVYIDSERFSALNGDARIYIAVAPASLVDVVTGGEWEVEIEAIEAPAGRFDAWIERDRRSPSQNQSFFAGDSFDPVGTLGTPATSRRGIAVANYAHPTLDIALSSSRGRTRDGRDKPEIAAPGTDIVSSHSLGGRDDGEGGTYPMRYATSGTSMAAPHVAGAVALLLEEEPSLSGPQIRSLLVASADPVEGVPGFDVAWGFGRLNALQALNLLRDPDRPGRATETS